RRAGPVPTPSRRSLAALSIPEGAATGAAPATVAPMSVGRTRLSPLKRRAPASGSSRPLERARRAFAERTFARALDAFQAADRAAALSGGDLDRLAMCEMLLGRDADGLRTLERAHHAHLESGAPLAAARSAFWLGFRLVSAGGTGRGTGLVPHARRLSARTRGGVPAAGEPHTPAGRGR